MADNEGATISCSMDRPKCTADSDANVIIIRFDPSVSEGHVLRILEEIVVGE